ncbi:hypothetical protein C8J56DRAFT_521337 [Mycena floridula]|nr:hypothetical protein C8J56DRAFT_521337 [Mycena floridula]
MSDYKKTVKKVKALKTYKPPSEKFLVVTDPWGFSKNCTDKTRGFFENVAAWFRCMNPKAIVTAIYHQGTHKNIIVELPEETDVDSLLGSHTFKDFLRPGAPSLHYHAHMAGVSNIYKYNYKYQNHPSEKQWITTLPDNRPIPANFEVKTGPDYPRPGTVPPPPLATRPPYAESLPSHIQLERDEYDAIEHAKALAAARGIEPPLPPVAPLPQDQNTNVGEGAQLNDEKISVKQEPCKQEETSYKLMKKMDPYQEEEETLRSLAQPFHQEPNTAESMAIDRIPEEETREQNLDFAALQLLQELIPPTVPDSGEPSSHTDNGVSRVKEEPRDIPMQHVPHVEPRVKDEPQDILIQHVPHRESDQWKSSPKPEPSVKDELMDVKAESVDVKIKREPDPPAEVRVLSPQLIEWARLAEEARLEDERRDRERAQRRERRRAEAAEHPEPARVKVEEKPYGLVKHEEIKREPEHPAEVRVLTPQLIEWARLAEEARLEDERRDRERAQRRERRRAEAAEHPESAQVKVEVKPNGLVKDDEKPNVTAFQRGSSGNVKYEARPNHTDSKPASLSGVNGIPVHVKQEPLNRGMPGFVQPPPSYDRAYSYASTSTVPSVPPGPSRDPRIRRE